MAKLVLLGIHSPPHYHTYNCRPCWTRQNTHNVGKWPCRIGLVARHKNNDHGKAIVDTYTMAVHTTDPARSVKGRASAPWLAFAEMYAHAGDIASARQVLTVTDTKTPSGVDTSGSLSRHLAATPPCRQPPQLTLRSLFFSNPISF